MIDLTALSRDELDEHRVTVLTEIERRDRMEQIPAQVAELSRTYQEGGGDAEVLIQAVTHIPEPGTAPE